MLRAATLLSLLLLSAVSLRAESQAVDSLYHFDRVDVVEYRTKVDKGAGVGVMVTNIDERAIEQNRSRSLSELLSNNSGLNVKSMGQGALSTLSFRGASSNQTEIMWRGISLNSTTLGSFDLSQIPIYFTDNVTLYHGSAAQGSGSGALGGSVNFSSDDSPIEGQELSVMGEYGSNNTISAGVTYKGQYGGVKLVTRGYYQQSDNDYRYLNNVYSSTPIYEDRANADYSQMGFMQELHSRSSRGDKLSIVAWLQMDSHSIPQSIISSTVAQEDTESVNVRGVISYEMLRGRHKIELTAANLWSDFDYTKESGVFLTESNNRGNSAVVKGEHSFKATQKIEVGSRLEYRNDIAESTSLEGGRVVRNTLSAQVRGAFKPTQGLLFDMGVTGEMVNGDCYAIYNVTARYTAIPKLLTLKASQAYNYRTPTLNDLYWSPGGNMDLQPERGFSWDCSAVVTPSLKGVDIELEALYFDMNIRDWIMWVPTSNGYIWSPVNYSKVRSRGAEINGSASGKIGDTRHALRASYTYAQTKDRTDSESDAYGKQLPYIPENKWSATYEVWWRERVWLSYNLSFTDVRYTTSDEEYYTPSYLVNNAEVGGVVSLRGVERLKISASVDNIFNCYYESTQYYPMPLRMFRVQCNYKF